MFLAVSDGVLHLESDRCDKELLLQRIFFSIFGGLSPFFGYLRHLFPQLKLNVMKMISNWPHCSQDAGQNLFLQLPNVTSEIIQETGKSIILRR